MADEDRYRAAPLREARTLAERVKRGELSSAIGDARAHEVRLADLLARAEAARGALAAAIAARDAQPTAARMALADRFVARRRRELGQALDELGRAEDTLDDTRAAVDTARRTLVRARADRELIDRHFARWREHRARLADRRED